MWQGTPSRVASAAQQAGKAILRYLQKRRPACRASELFVTVLPPYRKLSYQAVGGIVRRAIDRAGVSSPAHGAHVLRHSAATAMLRQGASLASIGSVLRHRSPQTTARYAKVDSACYPRSPSRGRGWLHANELGQTLYRTPFGTAWLWTLAGRSLLWHTRNLPSARRYSHQGLDRRGMGHRSVYPGTRYVRLNAVVLLARFLHAEDAGHEVPPSRLFPPPQGRLMPYIDSAEELSRIVAAAATLPRTYALRRAMYATLFGLIASTGLPISEALNIRLSDVQPGGVLLIRRGKGGKSRLIPLHSTVVAALNSYLTSRLNFPTVDDHLFVSARTRGISRSMANYTFRCVALHAGITRTGTRPCRIHDLRHTFATRSLRSAPHGAKILLLILWRWRRTSGT